MSWKQLEKAIKNRPKVPDKYYLCKPLKSTDFIKYAKEQQKWFEDFTKKFDVFKKLVVCIPRKQLEDFLSENPMEIGALVDWLEKLFEESK